MSKQPKKIVSKPDLIADVSSNDEVLAHSPTAPLFRREALLAIGERGLGELGHRDYRLFIAGSAIAALSTALLMALLALGTITLRITAVGIVMPKEGTIQLVAPIAGAVKSIAVKEGEQVFEGQEVAQLTFDRSLSTGFLSEATANAVREKQNLLQQEARMRQQLGSNRTQQIDKRIKSLSKELVEAENEARLLQRRVEISEIGFKRSQDLVQQGFLSESQLQAKEDELVELKSRTSSATRNASAIERDIKDQIAELKNEELQQASDLAQISRTGASLKQEATDNQARRGTVIRAPFEGIITTINMKAGSSIQSGQALAMMVPKSGTVKHTSLQAEIFVPSKSVGFVQNDQEAWIRYSAFPYQKYGLFRGVVRSVTATPISIQDLPPTQAQAITANTKSNEPVYRVVVDLSDSSVAANGAIRAIRPGMMLEADLIKDEWALWELLFEPLIAAAKNKVFSVKSSSEKGEPMQ
jgi:membrane fusion protein